MTPISLDAPPSRPECLLDHSLNGSAQRSVALSERRPRPKEKQEVLNPGDMRRYRPVATGDEFAVQTPDQLSALKPSASADISEDRLRTFVSRKEAHPSLRQLRTRVAGQANRLIVYSDISAVLIGEKGCDLSRQSRFAEERPVDHPVEVSSHWMLPDPTTGMLG